MSGDVVIRAERLGKQYIIGHEAERGRYVALRDVIARAARGAWRRTKDMARGRAIVAGDHTEEFWALTDVSFEVKRGEVVGIIGRNGAGKSTLLKILSRITEPSEGRVTIKGRVASLLEVGTGFHPELTGRENIYLNGAILGMTRAEIKRKFDEIVAFAEVEKFLATPVKRFSSGMYVRLAFAVAAHLEPEILIVDEVLAVGDAEFQKKCMGKMGEVARCGRTVLFVSHNMGAIRRLCDTAILLTRGSITFCGPAYLGVQKYSETGTVLQTSRLSDRRDRKGSGDLRFTELAAYSQCNGKPRMGDPFNVRLDFVAKRKLRKVNFSINIINYSSGQVVLRLSTIENGSPFACKAGPGSVVCTVPTFYGLAGDYSVTVAASTPPGFDHLDLIEDALQFTIEQNDVYATGKIPNWGIFYSPSSWTYLEPTALK